MREYVGLSARLTLTNFSSSLLLSSGSTLTYSIVCDIGEWCGWSDCDAECGPGQQTRVRTCDCPVGVECPATEESRECPAEEQNECAPEVSVRVLIADFKRVLKTQPKCEWTEWCQWSQCDGDCADGETRARTRMCDCDTPECDDSVKDDQCPGPNLEEEQCNKVLDK